MEEEATDARLMSEYAAERSEDAFRALVERHGKVATGAMEIEIKPKEGAAKPAGAPDEAAARKLALEFLKKRNESEKYKIAKVEDGPEKNWWVVLEQTDGLMTLPPPTIGVDKKNRRDRLGQGAK